MLFDTKQVNHTIEQVLDKCKGIAGCNTHGLKVLSISSLMEFQKALEDLDASVKAIRRQL